MGPTLFLESGYFCLAPRMCMVVRWSSLLVSKRPVINYREGGQQNIGGQVKFYPIQIGDLAMLKEGAQEKFWCSFSDWLPFFSDAEGAERGGAKRSTN